jgi:AbrB family looped-hinge helix DNA binding protein
MELIEMARMTSKGQVTVPAPIRSIFNLKKGSAVIFKVTDRGVFFLPCEITEREAYTPEERGKIKRLVAERGKSYRTSKEARDHLESL